MSNVDEETSLTERGMNQPFEQRRRINILQRDFPRVPPGMITRNTPISTVDVPELSDYVYTDSGEVRRIDSDATSRSFYTNRTTRPPSDDSFFQLQPSDRLQSNNILEGISSFFSSRGRTDTLETGTSFDVDAELAAALAEELRELDRRDADGYRRFFGREPPPPRPIDQRVQEWLRQINREQEEDFVNEMRRRGRVMLRNEVVEDVERRQQVRSQYGLRREVINVNEEQPEAGTSGSMTAHAFLERGRRRRNRLGY
jgi:hypothetical protein